MSITRVVLVDLFSSLDALCEEPTQLIVVGGAVMVLRGYKVSTKDVDVVSLIPRKLFMGSPVLGIPHGLPDDWLNDALAGFESVPKEYQEVIWEGKNLSIVGPNDWYLLYLKASVNHKDSHLEDMSRIVAANQWTFKEVQDIYSQVCGKSLPSNAYYHLRYTLAA